MSKVGRTFYETRSLLNTSHRSKKQKVLPSKKEKTFARTAHAAQQIKRRHMVVAKRQAKVAKAQKAGPFHPPTLAFYTDGKTVQ